MNQSIRRQAAAVILSLYLFFILCSTVGFADAEMRRIVVGADLTEEQVLSVYAEFGIRRGDIPELKLTNAEVEQYFGAIQRTLEETNILK